MTSLTRIQIAVHLQGVELFTYCSAEQMMRIAGIARQCRFEPGEKIYAANDPAEAMFCIAQGAVRVAEPGGRERRIEPHGTFGVREILSDRLREADAFALEETLALAIDAEDFFDLLSNHIEIVRALFRQLLRPPAAKHHEVPDAALAS